MRSYIIAQYMALALGVAGCIPEPRDLGSSGGQMLSPAQARSVVADRTNLLYGSFHGTQVEYTSANGEAFLWYPGNAVILSGYWKIETAAPYGAPQLCFSYGEATYNPSTGRGGGGWQCAWARDYWQRIVEARNGDYLGLEARRAAPFWLSREPTTLDDLRSRVLRSGS
jgi:hypothetical protein